MQRICFFLIVCLFFMQPVFSQSAAPGELNGKVVFITVAVQGTVTVSCTGFAKKKAESIANAAAGAVYTLLFRGIAGSPYDMPMVPNENEKKNDPVVVALLDGGYTAFITENTLQSEENKKRKQDGMKGKQTVNRITINCDALRRHLEQNNVIRKFGI